MGVIGDDQLDQPVFEWMEDIEADVVDARVLGITALNSAVIVGSNCSRNNSLLVFSSEICSNDLDCSMFPFTKCSEVPLANNSMLRFKGCQCLDGYSLIPNPYHAVDQINKPGLNRGCYDSIVETKTVNGPCLAQRHCTKLKGTSCSRSDPDSTDRFCSCIPGASPMPSNPDTRLVLGCLKSNATCLLYTSDAADE